MKFKVTQDKLGQWRCVRLFHRQFGTVHEPKRVNTKNNQNALITPEKTVSKTQHFARI